MSQGRHAWPGSKAQGKRNQHPASTYPRNVFMINEELVFLLPNGSPNHNLAGVLLRTEEAAFRRETPKDTNATHWNTAVAIVKDDLNIRACDFLHAGLVLLQKIGLAMHQTVLQG